MHGVCLEKLQGPPRCGELLLQLRASLFTFFLAKYHILCYSIIRRHRSETIVGIDVTVKAEQVWIKLIPYQ